MGTGEYETGHAFGRLCRKTLPQTTDRLPVGFRAFDYYDATTKTAYSVKTLDTQTRSRLNKPNQLYSSVKENITKGMNFNGDTRLGINLDSSMISNKEIKLAIPESTTPEQWAKINRAIEYRSTQGIKVNVTQVKK
ncbi:MULTISPECIES: endonuclease toxin domain-containing protein [Pantoea]|uniref:endonuclease toxin domain-containing protein n=1 Tax=Pantoea TaxID=53335 RepID=UPI001D337E7D|nr:MULTISPECIES: hypothetical protein [Pantoea]MBZ6387000.1 hypothetical protein [Pantoea piersonii]MBZ6400260.1 hypothetical protein [Pantoea piersonii]MBZ6408353.1 hypothetical protein [Pantoea piersonii]MBZ6426540.1 hypothetical protein [Pantoea piersonii]WBV23221.1 hypothetical protein PG877_08815 [Pantoea piersonii]